jgi:hypothetical protein
VDGLHHELSSLIGILMFPDAHGSPPRLGQTSIGVVVPLPVTTDLRLPVLVVSLREPAVVRTAVPVATVDEDGHTSASKHHVSATREGSQWLRMYEISEAKPMDGPADSHLRASVARTVGLHGAAGCAA